MKKIIGLGNAIVDRMTQIKDEQFLTDNGLQKGGMFLVDETTIAQVLEQSKHLEQKQTSGGSAANTIHGLAKLGADVAYIGKVGQDEVGAFFVKDLEASGITTKLKYSQTSSGLAAALVTPDAERTFATYLGAAVEMTPEDITPELFEGYDILHIEGYLVFNQALVEKALKTAKSLGMEVSIDMASFNVVEANLEFLQNMVKEYVDILFANEEESKAFTGLEPKSSCEEIAKSARIAVVKIGKEGAYIKAEGQDIVLAPAYTANSIDTTGAGDSYAAGFLYGYTNGASLYNSSRIGAKIASKVIEHIGAKMPETEWEAIRPEIQKLIEA
ncbi:MAG: adenosine kinase [Bacteroidales bacterium]|nr:adenosine kinase [Bacteroidales bacterium]